MTQPAARARRTQAERTATTRAALLRAAVEVIARRGYTDASLDQIAAAAGLTKGAVLYHFRAKQDLVSPVLDACVGELRARAAAAWGREGPPGDRMRAALRAMWTARRDGTPAALALLDLVARAAHDEAVRAAVLAAYQAAERDLSDELDRGIAALGLRARVPPAALARLLLALLDGATLHGRVTAGEPDGAALEAAEALALAAFTV